MAETRLVNVPTQAGAIVVRAGTTLTRSLAPTIAAKAEEHGKRLLSHATERAYALDWSRFAEWCAAHNVSALPAGELTIVAHVQYLDEVLGLAHASAARAYASIRVKHIDAGERLPTLDKVVQALKRLKRKHRGRGPKKALEYEQCCRACDRLPDTLEGAFDRVVLLFGELFAGRRSEIAALRVEDLEFNAQGVVVLLRKSKTDQDGEGRRVAIVRRASYCPVQALETWLRRADIGDGLVFRRALDGQFVSDAVKRAAASLGLDPRQYGAHSLRRGFVTTASKEKQDLHAIMRTTGHQSVEMVRRYIDDADPFAHVVRFKDEKELSSEPSGDGNKVKTEPSTRTASTRSRGTTPSTGSAVDATGLLTASAGEPSTISRTVPSTLPARTTPSSGPTDDSSASRADDLKTQIETPSSGPAGDTSSSPATGDPPSQSQTPSSEQPDDIDREITHHPTTGQPLVNRRKQAAIAYRRDGRPANLAWLRAQITALRARRFDDRLCAELLNRVGVRRGNGDTIDAADVAKF